MIVLENMNEDHIKEATEASIEKKAKIKSDGLSSYKVLRKYDYEHTPVKVYDPKLASHLLRWTHVIISNAKAMLLGTYHGVSQKHLQRYLSEFCYRFSRRFDQTLLFDRLIWACVKCKPVAIAEVFE